VGWGGLSSLVEEFIAEESETDRFGNAFVTFGYGRFLSRKYRGKGQGRLRLNQCKGECLRSDFAIPILQTKEGLRHQVYTAKHKNEGLAKCRQCGYITGSPQGYGTRCPCCGHLLTNAPRRMKYSPHYIEPKDIE
jgi:hypothetical protein